MPTKAKKSVVDQDSRAEAKRLAACLEKANTAIEKGRIQMYEAEAVAPDEAPFKKICLANDYLCSARRSILEAASLLCRLSKSKGDRLPPLGRQTRQAAPRRKAVAGRVPKMPRRHPQLSKLGKTQKPAGAGRRLERLRQGRQNDQSQPWEIER